MNRVTLCNKELHNLVKLPSSTTLILPRQLKLLYSVVVEQPCERARWVVFARIANPREIASGQVKDGYTR